MKNQSLNSKPILCNDLPHKALPAVGRPSVTTIKILDLPSSGIKNPRVLKEKGQIHVVCDVGGDGIPSKHRRQHIPITVLSGIDIKSRKHAADLRGYRPQGQSTLFRPAQAKLTHQFPKGKGKGRKIGGTIFDTDNRYLFHDTAFPWRTTGKINTVGKWGSGTTIGPRLVLTASHVVDWTDKGASWLSFTPGYYDGSGPWGTYYASRVIFWEKAPSSLSDKETAFDYVVLVMEDRVGDIVGYPGYREYDNSWNDGSYWQYIGYPGELSSGERPAFQDNCIVERTKKKKLDGHAAFVMGHFNEFTPGQSGGALWGWWDGEDWPRVVGVGSTIGSTAVRSKSSSDSGNDNEYGGGEALAELISYARSTYP